MRDDSVHKISSSTLHWRGLAKKSKRCRQTSKWEMHPWAPRTPQWAEKNSECQTSNNLGINDKHKRLTFLLINPSHIFIFISCPNLNFVYCIFLFFSLFRLSAFLPKIVTITYMRWYQVCRNTGTGLCNNIFFVSRE
jgi:hypothetical protein